MYEALLEVFLLMFLVIFWFQISFPDPLFNFIIAINLYTFTFINQSLINQLFDPYAFITTQI